MALRRQQEREADAMTAQIVGERTHSDALLRLAVRRALTDEQFWKPFDQRATREPSRRGKSIRVSSPRFSTTSINWMRDPRFGLN